jgi:hypothetical protein
MGLYKDNWPYVQGFGCQKSMGYGGVWVNRTMGYWEFDCT